MIPRRKVRADAKLEQLSADQHEQLILWLDDENCSYTEVVARVRQEFGLSVGRTAVAGFYQRHVVPLHHDAQAEAAAALITQPEGAFDAATIKQAKWLAWSALSSPWPQIETAAKLLDLVQRAKYQEIAERRLELQTRRVAVQEKAAAHRALRRRKSTEIEQSLPKDHPVQTPHTEMLSQKIPQNPPLYSPYFALNRAQEPRVKQLPTDPKRPDFADDFTGFDEYLSQDRAPALATAA